MASLYERYVIPWFINCACSSPIIAKQREKILPEASGRVLELGMGPGINIPYYDTRKVTEVDGLEPSDRMRQMAEAKGKDAGLKVEVLAGKAEALPFEAASFDCVVCTFTLCSVEDPGAALAEARRVLKPGGRFIFCEHGLAPDPDVVKWQRRIEPVWKHLAGGCHLTRPVTPAIEAAGFQITRREQMYVPRTPRWAGWNEWGVGVRA